MLLHQHDKKIVIYDVQTTFDGIATYDDIATYVDIATSLDVDISTYDAGSS